MTVDFVTMGEMNNQELAQKFRELGDEDTALYYENGDNKESLFKPAWRATGHQIGFLPIFASLTERYQPIIAASSLEPDTSLQGQAVNIRLTWLHAYEYPRSRFDVLAGTDHDVLFTAEAHNQASDKSEEIAFSQVYRVRGGQDAAIAGYPIFIGLNVGANGLAFSCGVISVSNEQDEKLLMAIDSPAMQAGLSLLKTVQPGLIPFANVARGLAKSLGDPKRSRNRGVQKVLLGLDFDQGATGLRLAIGSYLAVQTPDEVQINWDEWCYDTQSGRVVSVEPNQRGHHDILPYNALMFSVNKYK